ncbi:hypothetical protein MPER_11928, partial [Moniliophthora perniciosa FA553]
ATDDDEVLDEGKVSDQNYYQQDERDEILVEVWSAARGFERVVRPFRDLRVTVEIGMARMGKWPFLIEHDQKGVDEGEDGEFTHLFLLMLYRNPYLVILLKYLNEKGDTDGFENMLTFLAKNSPSACIGDCSRMKQTIEKCLLPHPFTKSALTLNFAVKSKADRGVVNNLVVFYWMTSTQMRHVFEDPSDQEQIDDRLQDVLDDYRRRDDPLAFDHNDIPAMFYDVPKAVEKKGCNEEVGLLMSPFLMKCLRVVVTGVGSIDGAKRKRDSRADVAQILGVDTVTPELIAYIATLARFSMSQVDSWQPTDGDFDLDIFYQNVTEIIYGGDAVWRKKLLEEWNLSVFGSKTGRNERPVVMKPSKPTSGMEALRQGRRMAKALKVFKEAAAIGKKKRGSEELAEAVEQCEDLLEAYGLRVRKRVWKEFLRWRIDDRGNKVNDGGGEDGPGIRNEDKEIADDESRDNDDGDN